MDAQEHVPWSPRQQLRTGRNSPVQQVFGTVPNGEERVQWGNDTWRVDAAVGYRFTNYLQGKVQYSFTHDEAKIQVGEQLIAAQLTIKF